MEFKLTRKEDPAKLEAQARENAIKHGNDIVELLDLDSAELWKMIRQYGQGDPIKASCELAKNTNDQSLKVASYLLGDAVKRSEEAVRVEWNVPMQTKFEASTMRSYHTLKDGDDCLTIQPAIWAKYKDPTTGMPKEFQIRYCIAAPLKP